MADSKLLLYSKFLRDDVSRKYGKRLETSTDFANLSQSVRESKAGYVSQSTLKRFWGYVRDTYSARRTTTLDILAAYIGYDSFSHYCLSIEKGEEDISGYNTSMSLDVQTLSAGTILSIRWHPDRNIVMTYQGDLTFVVDEVKNSRLKKGSRVRVMTIVKGEPLILSVLAADSSVEPMTYISGKKNGVEWEIL